MLLQSPSSLYCCQPLCPNPVMAASSSSSSSSSTIPVESPPQDQVFINFRGKELRKGFVSHLVKALKRDGINAFIDEDETKGNDLSSLFSRIAESKVALAIFSSMYTESKWCLNELVKMKECVDSGKLVAIPIFYRVETNDVKNLEGVFGAKFCEWVKICDGEQLNKWKDALEVVTNRMGFVLGETSDEGETIIKIVQQVTKVLSSNVSTDPEREVLIDDPSAGTEETPEADPDYLHPLFGIETRLKQLEDKSDFKCEYHKNTTLKIGVVGMPGIGKTTLMNKLYDKGQQEFIRCVFLPHVRNMNFNGNRDILVEELLKDDEELQKVAPGSLRELLGKNKSFVVLDHVSDKKQIEDLLSKCDWIKGGSRIFITTSDRSVIEGMVDDTYEVRKLNGRDSYKCFNHFAFSGKLPTPEGNFMNLSKLFVDYAKGNPFVLKILGVELCGKEETYWTVKLNELAQSPIKKIEDVLRISYDGLSQLQKDVFLDVACFFKSGDEYYVRCLVDSCDTEPIDGVSEIKDLASKFLLDISGGRMEMHDLLYTFGKELDPQGLRRLWNHEHVVGVLKKRAGADSVRGIFLDMLELKKKLPLDKCTFTEMRNLRYLKFYSSRCHREGEADCKLNFPDELEFSLDEVRYLYWLKFPMKKLPKDFNPKNLTDLNLPYSEIKEVWEGLKDTPKLKWVDLSHSSKLCNLTGLLNATSLQRLNLEGCTSLEELPREVKCMQNLVFLNMRGCTSLRGLPKMNLISMKTLILTNCSSLEDFQVISYNIETLHLDGTAIVQLPTDMVKLQRLIVLNLKDCKLLRAVPKCLGRLKALQELVMSGCSTLKTFSVPIENMKCLQILLLDGTEITEIPKILQCNSSKVEDLHELRCGMKCLSSLRRLCLSSNDMIRNLQIDISQLYHLKWLDLKYCKNLTSISLLPPNLEILDAHGCGELKIVASPMALLKLMEQVQSKFIFTNCNKLEQVAKNSITSYAQRKSLLDALRCYKEGTVSDALLITCFPGSEVPSWFNHQTFGSELKLKFPPHWCDNRLSTLVLCAVVKFPEDEINRFSIECTCEFKNEVETCIRFSCTLGGGWIEPRKIDSDHVFIGYTSCSHITKHLEGSLKSQEHHKYVPTEASIEFTVRHGAGEIVNCGLSLVYEESNYVVVEGNCNGTSSRRDLSVRYSVVSFTAAYLSDALRFMWPGVVFIMAYCFARFFGR
ncbi:PREDICTED: disease resistance protein RPS4-like [Camelina sativa]|uniref:ADP-ribosyl cyclase/cyclic ADP-ribose hydrolase n=1 Tax=Camelina sativa TaxID=90675 RepID=A0ABM0U857_CAMSA|nr:PREDICTED: disease resistance protein RPS4-like [Camelina sativa]